MTAETKSLLRSKYEELNFHDFDMIDWIMAQENLSKEEKINQFLTLTTFPEYGEPDTRK